MTNPFDLHKREREFVVVLPTRLKKKRIQKIVERIGKDVDLHSMSVRGLKNYEYLIRSWQIDP